MRTMLGAICALELTLSQVRVLHLPKGDKLWCEICLTEFPCATYNLAMGDPLQVVPLSSTRTT